MSSELQKQAAPEPRRITLAELKALRDAGEDVLILDVRSEESYNASDVKIPGSLRISPHDLSAAAKLPRDRLIVTYCT